MLTHRQTRCPSKQGLKLLLASLSVCLVNARDGLAGRNPHTPVAGALETDGDPLPALGTLGRGTVKRLPDTVREESRLASSDDRDGVDWTEVEEQLEGLSWTVGSLRVVPYGAFWADIVYATQRTNAGPFTLWVFSEEEQGEPAFAVDARRSRFGLDIEGPSLGFLGDASSEGRVEIDFFGSFVTENRAGVLLRHVYWAVENDTFRFLVGQTWDVVSPLRPRTVNYSGLWNAGDIGFRRAQVRLERFFVRSSACRWFVQASINQDIVTDFPADPGVRREAAGWPVVEGRVACQWNPPGAGQDAIEVGVSGHVGETGFDFLTPGPVPLSLPVEDDARFLTWSANADVRIPFNRYLGFQGEFFTGSNLSAFLGGIGQGVCPCVRIPIRSTGGWAEVWINWNSRLHSHGGFGIDDPLDRDFLFGRSYNQVIFGNLMCDVTDQLTIGFEVSLWKTLFRETRAGMVPADQLNPTAPGEAVVVDFMLKYGF